MQAQQSFVFFYIFLLYNHLDAQTCMYIVHLLVWPFHLSHQCWVCQEMESSYRKYCSTTGPTYFLRAKKETRLRNNPSLLGATLLRGTVGNAAIRATRRAHKMTSPLVSLLCPQLNTPWPCVSNACLITSLMIIQAQIKWWVFVLDSVASSVWLHLAHSPDV